MLRASWFFVFILVTDAFVLPLRRLEPPQVPSLIPFDQVLMKLMMFVMPFASVVMAFKSVDMMIKSNILMHKMSMQFTKEDKMHQNHDHMHELLHKSVDDPMTLVSKMTDKKYAPQLLCELTVDQRIGRQDKEFAREYHFMRKQKEYEENINKLISMNAAESGILESFCGRYSGCPFGVENMSLGLEMLRNSWSHGRMPQTDFPFIMDEDYYDYLMRLQLSYL